MIMSVDFLKLTLFIFSLSLIRFPKIFTAEVRETTKGVPPKFREEHNPRSFEVPLYDKLKLRCPVSGSPKPSLQWFKFSNGSQLTINSTEHTQIVRYSLTIPNITESDGGFYFCEARNNHGFIRQNFTVQVTERYIQEDREYVRAKRPGPRIVKTKPKFAPYLSKEINVELMARPVGKSATLNCPVNGSEPIHIKWLKNGSSPTRESEREIIYKKYTLIMNDLQMSDSGVYRCIASNSEGKVNFTYSLHINEPVPHRPIFREGYPSNTTVYLGERAVFECRFLKDISPIIRWIKLFQINGSYADSSEVPYIEPLETEDPHVLVIEEAKFEDEGLYSCVAANDIGVTSRGAYLKVLPPSDGNEAEMKAVLINSDSSAVITLAVFVSGTFCVIAFFICWMKCKTKPKFIPKGSHMILTKKVVIEKNDNPNSVIPFVKIDYSMMLSSEPSTPDVEYELPVDFQYEFPRERLKLGQVLGEGAFAVVVQAEALGLQSQSLSTTVAVKMLKEDHTDSDLLELFSEIQLMKNIGKHVNILSLNACCTQGGPLYAILEYAKKGNLRDYLRANRNPIRPPSGYEIPITSKYKNSNLTFKNLVSFAYQTAKGMAYLISKGCIHRDLAARNVLLNDDDIIKIADFGLSRDLQHQNYYKKSTHGKLPIKWMAPEALSERIFSSQSDVWSYGILLYEIFTFGLTPYPEICYEDLYYKLKCGHRMSKPDSCPAEIYHIMRCCWEFAPKDRPSFDDIVTVLDRILLNSLEIDYLEFDFPSLTTPENSSSSDEEG